MQKDKQFYLPYENHAVSIVLSPGNLPSGFGLNFEHLPTYWLNFSNTGEKGEFKGMERSLRYLLWKLSTQVFSKLFV